MFNKQPYVLEFEKSTQKDMEVTTIIISAQAGTETECLRMLDHALALR